ncbi:MAG TPA: adenylate/guanylate cyclase domain-containing protein [Candidatus Acidoferrales bacterium]|nr:adenylate/guanylate cyclase domain-containing protein [Candidatus Acidoferrales bacterium]
MPDGSDKAAPQPGAQSGSQIIERKLATILSADVAEFSRLMNEDEEQTLRVFRGHKKVFDSLVATHHGRVFNTAGDAILAEFSSAVEAVRCATDVQSALRTRNDKFPPSRQVRFRIGINLGDVMIQGQDLLGDGVNVAARLQTAAEPGGICISGSVHDQIRNKLSLAFHSLGERSYKNIPQPVRTFSIVEAEGGVTLPSPKPSSAWKNPAIWAVAGLVLVAGIGYAAYAIHARGDNATAPVTAVNPPPAPAPAPATTPASASSSVEKPAAAPPASAPSATAASSSPKAAPAEAEAKPVAKSNEPAASAPAKSPRATAHAGRFDGTYGGQVCYGQTPKLPKHCYQAEGTVVANKLSGHWNMPGERAVTMHIEGDVRPSGDVTIFMHSEDQSGARVATINMTGTIQEGSLVASGAFERGRPANLNWRLTGHDSPVQPSGVTGQQPIGAVQPVQPSQSIEGTWELVSSTTNGVTRTIKPTRITITQSGSLVRVGGQELRLTDEGTLTYQEFYAHDERYGHRVETPDQADLIDTLTWRIKGSMLVFETVFDYRAPYNGHPVGKLVRIMEYRRVTP